MKAPSSVTSHDELVLHTRSPEEQYRTAKGEGEYKRQWQSLQAMDSIFSVWYSARGLL